MGVFAAIVAIVPQVDTSAPASATVGLLRKVIETSSELPVQVPFVMVQRSTYVLPAVPVNVEELLAGFVIVPPAPVTIVHAPVPTAGTLAARVAELQTV